MSSDLLVSALADLTTVHFHEGPPQRATSRAQCLGMLAVQAMTYASLKNGVVYFTVPALVFAFLWIWASSRRNRTTPKPPPGLVGGSWASRAVLRARK
jgi:hypothetical protein